MDEYQLHITHISMYSREMIAPQKVKNKIKQTSKKTWRIGSQNQTITEDISPKMIFRCQVRHETMLQSMESQRKSRTWLIDWTELNKMFQLCLILCNHMYCSPSGFSVHGILHARILLRVAMPSSSLQFLQGWTQVSYVSCIGRWVLYH